RRRHAPPSRPERRAWAASQGLRARAHPRDPAQGSRPRRNALRPSRAPALQRSRPADPARTSRTRRRAPPASSLPPRGRRAQLSLRRRLRPRHCLRGAVGRSRRSALEPAERAALFLERARGADGLGSGRTHPRGGGGGARSLSRRPPPLFIDSPGGAPLARRPALVLRPLSAPRAPGGYAGLAGGERARVPLARALGALLRPAGAGEALRRSRPACGDGRDPTAGPESRRDGLAPAPSDI